jgi:hypothetical protein
MPLSNRMVSANATVVYLDTTGPYFWEIIKRYALNELWPLDGNQQRYTVHSESHNVLPGAEEVTPHDAIWISLMDLSYKFRGEWPTLKQEANPGFYTDSAAELALVFLGWDMIAPSRLRVVVMPMSWDARPYTEIVFKHILRSIAQIFPEAGEQLASMLQQGKNSGHECTNGSTELNGKLSPPEICKLLDSIPRSSGFWWHTLFTWYEQYNEVVGQHIKQAELAQIAGYSVAHVKTMLKKRREIQEEQADSDGSYKKVL